MIERKFHDTVTSSKEAPSRGKGPAAPQYQVALLADVVSGGMLSDNAHLRRRRNEAAIVGRL